ncbi:MAG: hypothetical protein AAB300_03315 [Nitrospirota bacterium]
MVAKTLRFSIVLAVFLCMGCTSYWAKTCVGPSAWQYRKVGTREIAILCNPEKTLPTYVSDWAAVVKASDGEKFAEVAANTTAKSLFDPMDQINAQYRNFLVVSYAMYINDELKEASQSTSTATSAPTGFRWFTKMGEIHSELITFRSLFVQYSYAIEATEKNLNSALLELAALGFPDPGSMAVVAAIEAHVQNLKNMERDLPAERRSPIAALAESILLYRKGSYGTVIDNLATPKSQHPLQDYILAAAYWKQKNFSEAEKVSSQFMRLAEKKGDKRLKAMAYMQEAIIQIEIAKKDTPSQNSTSTIIENRREALNKAIGNFTKAIDEDPGFWPAFYNRANSYSELSRIKVGTAEETKIDEESMKQCLIDFRHFVEMSKTPFVFVKEMVEEDSKQFETRDDLYNLFSYLNQEAKKRQPQTDWATILKEKIS